MLDLLHIPEDRVQTFGPFDFVQVTYEALRVGPNGGIELAWFHDGIWETADGQFWSDFSVYAGRGK